MCCRLHPTRLLLIALLLTSCMPLSTPEPTPFAARQTPRDCAEVIDAIIESFPFYAEAEAARVWVQTQYMLRADKVPLELSADGRQSMLNWHQPAKRTYSVLLWNDARESAVVTVRWSAQPPALADVLRCLGDPPLYRAFLAPTQAGDWTYLELWYPERGIAVTAFVTHKVSGFTISQAVAAISYVPPGPPEDIITRFSWTTTRDDDEYTQILKGLKPWPGDITKITIDERG